MNNFMLTNIRKYLLGRAKSEGIDIPHTFKVENISISAYYSISRLSPQARKDFERTILRHGHEYGLTLKSIGRTHYLIELNEV